jgi:hypothetical protein
MLECEMKTADLNSIRRSWYYWLTLVPLVVGSSLALLRYAGWAAVYSGNYDRASQASLLKEASSKANLYWWVLAVLSLAATVVATILIPPFKSEAVPAGLKAVIRFGLAVLLVAGSMFVVTYGLLAVGHYLK